MANFLPYKKTMDALETTLSFKNTVKLHGVPQNIVSDQDVKFTSNFWRTLWRLLSCDLKISTAFQPQSNGQTEVVYYILDSMLRCLVKSVSDLELVLAYAEFFTTIQLTGLLASRHSSCAQVMTLILL